MNNQVHRALCRKEGEGKERERKKTTTTSTCTVHYAPSAGGARGWSGGSRSRATLARSHSGTLHGHIFVCVCPIPKPLAPGGRVSRGSPFYVNMQCATRSNTQPSPVPRPSTVLLLRARARVKRERRVWYSWYRIISTPWNFRGPNLIG